MNNVSQMSFSTFFRDLLLWTAICFVHVVPVLSQETSAGRILRFSSHHTSFPDSAREQGHNYDSLHYSASEHYHDSTVLLIVPEHLDRKRKLDLVFWFHGWNNNID